VDADHLILLGNFVQERMFVVGEERVGDPDLVREVTRESHVFVCDRRGERQALVLPVLIHVDCDGVVLIVISTT